MLDSIYQLLDNEKFKTQVIHEYKNFKANEKIMIEGKEYDSLYLIQTGKVRILIRGEFGDECHIHPGIVDLGPGDIFGEFTLFNDLPASADIVAVVESELVAINKNSFREFLESNTDIGYKVLLEIFKVYVQRLIRSNKAILHLLEWGMKAHNIDKYLK